MNELLIKEYHFNIELAKKYGVDESIYLHNLIFWIDKNRANNINFKEGHYWTFNNLEALCKLFPFWTKRQIQRIIKSLQDSGAIKVNHYNKNKYNRTNWYTIIDKTIIPNGVMQETKRGDRTPQTGKCINIYNKQHIENLSSKEDKSISKEIQNTHFKINSNIKEIIKNSLLKKTFKKVMFPEDYKNNKITNSLKNIHKYLLAFKNNNYHLYTLDKKWIIDNKRRFENINTDAKLGRLLNKSICRYIKMQTNTDYWPKNKKKLTNDFINFLYNPIEKTSWFLYCLCNEPKLLKDAINNTNAKKIMQSIPEPIQEISAKLLRPNWKAIEFWKAIKSMYDWYEENTVKLREFNYSIDQDCGCSYKAVVGTFRRLLSLYHTYTGTWQIFNIGSFGMDNKVWPLFLEWAWKTEQVSLDFVPKKNPEYETDVADVYN